ncbi:alpha/beta fold hydrolase [Vibrio hannami]|uniref:alpha/beta fold hydrolase n=1 Tax=Vibrio hannami TaxID=2717094 RepID=UPI00240EAF5B|nr:alpha/beta fold hydrolase [Vibrio hannami]MDG3087448.1 alpha/beta fold hydrolase [Vibrio hannami]
MSEMLNYKLQGSGPNVLLIHGLFGNLDNLGLIARDLVTDYQVLSVDLRNHGLSFHSDDHTYQAMTDDIYELVAHLHLADLHVIGHSMGGKVAMRFASDHADLCKSMIVMDMAPVAYKQRKHDNVFAGLQAVVESKPTKRSQAMQLMAQHIEMEGVRQFLGKSLFSKDGYLQWRFNVPSILKNYWNILGWETIKNCEIPTLFLKGANSDYLTQEHQPLVQQQFSNAKAHVIANTGHWLHAEKPSEVIRAIRRFLVNN